MLIDMKTLLDEATKKGYCVPAPSVFNALTIETAFSRAVKVHSPVILNAGGPLDFEFLAETAKFYSRRNPEVPVALNLDHGDDFDQAMRAIRAGFTSVMLDKSSAPFEENVRETKEVVHAAHIVGVSVEAELGCVGFGQKNDGENTDSFTKPEDVDIFIRETGADCLAIAIGTAHGHYKGTPKIDFERLDAIRAVTSVPLVLHGGSSTGEENLKKAVRHGISKVNIGTDLSDAAKGNIIDFLSDHDPHQRGVYGKMLTAGMQGYGDKLEEYMILFGSAGRW